MTKQTAKQSHKVQQNTSLVVIPHEAKPSDNQDIPNSPDLSALAKEAITALASSDKMKGKANALMTYVIAQAYFTKTFETTVIYKDSRELCSFDLEDIATKAGVLKADGKQDTKLSVARVNQVAIDLFSVTGELDAKGNLLKGKRFNQSQLNTFNRALNLVYSLLKLNVRTVDIQLDDDKKNLCVPFHLFNDKPEAKFATRLAVYEQMKDMIVPILSFDDLEKKVYANPLLGKKTKGKGKSKDAAQILSDNLSAITEQAKVIKAKLDKHEVDTIEVDLRKKMNEAMIAIGQAFEAEKKAQKASEDAEQAELKEKAKIKQSA